MTMIEGFAELIPPFAVGLSVGLASMYVLWLTVRRLSSRRRPLPWLLLSTMVRLTLVLSAFYWIMDGSWQRLLACLGGFLVARVAATGWVKFRRHDPPRRREMAEPV